MALMFGTTVRGSADRVAAGRLEVGNSFSVVAKLCHAIIDRKHRL
jgi:hypothetical protein